jgi:hypothetical protein
MGRIFRPTAFFFGSDLGMFVENLQPRFINAVAGDKRMPVSNLFQPIFSQSGQKGVKLPVYLLLDASDLLTLQPDAGTGDKRLARQEPYVLNWISS